MGHHSSVYRKISVQPPHYNLFNENPREELQSSEQKKKRTRHEEKITPSSQNWEKNGLPGQQSELPQINLRPRRYHFQKSTRPAYATEQQYSWPGHYPTDFSIQKINTSPPTAALICLFNGCSSSTSLSFYFFYWSSILRKERGLAVWTSYLPTIFWPPVVHLSFDRSSFLHDLPEHSINTRSPRFTQHKNSTPNLIFPCEEFRCRSESGTNLLTFHSNSPFGA